LSACHVKVENFHPGAKNPLNVVIKYDSLIGQCDEPQHIVAAGAAVETSETAIRPLGVGLVRMGQDRRSVVRVFLLQHLDSAAGAKTSAFKRRRGR
jgi:hypothetical protein